jgi:hypothetical protein
MDRALNVAHMPADVIATFPLSVVLALLAAARQLNTRNYLPQETFVQLSNGVLGSIVTQHTSVIPAPETMAALEQVFQRGCDAITVGCTGLLSETTARFPVPNTPLAIVIDVRFSAKGPYATSRLVDDKTDAVVMRNDTPRLFSLHGVYLFPTADYGLISLVAFHRG